MPCDGMTAPNKAKVTTVTPSERSAYKKGSLVASQTLPRLDLRKPASRSLALNDATVRYRKSISIKVHNISI